MNLERINLEELHKQDGLSEIIIPLEDIVAEIEAENTLVEKLSLDCIEPPMKTKAKIRFNLKEAVKLITG